MVILNYQNTLTGGVSRGRPGALKDLLTLYLLDFPNKSCISAMELSDTLFNIYSSGPKKSLTGGFLPGSAGSVS